MSLKNDILIPGNWLARRTQRVRQGDRMQTRTYEWCSSQWATCDFRNICCRLIVLSLDVFINCAWARQVCTTVEWMTLILLYLLGHNTSPPHKITTYYTNRATCDFNQSFFCQYDKYVESANYVKHISCQRSKEQCARPKQQLRKEGRRKHG